MATRSSATSSRPPAPRIHRQMTGAHSWGHCSNGHLTAPAPLALRVQGTDIDMLLPRGAPDRSAAVGRLARADGGSGVVTPVVEMRWTGSAARDAVRYRGAEYSADAGPERRGEPA